MTEHFYIIIEQPLVVNSLKILTAKLRGVSFKDAMEWYPEHHTKFHIINKKTGEKISEEVSYQSDAFFVFHTVNAYEDDGYIVLDIIAMDKEFDAAKFINRNLSLETLQMASNDDEEVFQSHFRPRRYVLPIQYEMSNLGVNLVQISDSKCEALLQEGKDNTNTKVKCVMKCIHEMIADLVMEFPQINYRKFNGRKYRYIYGAHSVRFREADGLVKIDIDTKEILRWEEKNVVPSEPVFLASPNAIEEDDGVLLSVGLTLGDERCAYLLVINAKDMKEIGRAKVNVQIGAGIHGIFIQKK
jgi:beta,beta-carotene 9',10'-dioxygenase